MIIIIIPITYFNSFTIHFHSFSRRFYSLLHVCQLLLLLSTGLLVSSTHLQLFISCFTFFCFPLRLATFCYKTPNLLKFLTIQQFFCISLVFFSSIFKIEFCYKSSLGYNFPSCIGEWKTHFENASSLDKTKKLKQMQAQTRFRAETS